VYLRLVYFTKQRVQSLQARAPKGLLLRDPFLDQVQRFWPESENVLPTDFSPLNQSRPFQHPKMFGN
jgi:hypothetical protein